MINANVIGFGEKTVFGVRSQARNGARELAGWQRHIYKPDQDSSYLTFAVSPEYSHSFRQGNIADFLFGCKQLVFSGSLVPDREENEILADYFGLPSDFCSTVHFNPEIINFVMDFDIHVGMDGLLPGLYWGLHFPIVHTKWDLQLVECIADPGTTFTSYPGGYFSDEAIELSALTQGETAPKNVQTVFQGKAVFGDMREPLKYGKIFGRQDATRLADLTATLGYNILLTDSYHFGLNIRAVAPTGTLRDSIFLFEPIAGNDHHWELGGGFSFHVDFCRDEETNRKAGIYVVGNLTHLFNSNQRRSFDLTNGFGSRYMLLQTIAAPSVGLHVLPGNTAAENQYQGRLVPAINRTTLCADISIPVQGELVVKLYYQNKGFEFDLGYNGWGKSAEKLKCRESIAECYALKGDAQLYGFNAAETSVALNATQSHATINGGQDIPDNDDAIGKGNLFTGNELTNANADNPVGAADNLGTALNNLRAADAATFGFAQQAVQTSNPAILVTNADINDCSALLPRALSHKIFVYTGYTRNRDVHIVPYIGVGAFIEWACVCVCDNSASSQWGVWLKGGVTY